MDRPLLRGLDNKDTISDLHYRAKELPDDLERFFQFLLDTIEDVYRKHTERILRTPVTSTITLPVINLYYLDRRRRARLRMPTRVCIVLLSGVN